MLLASDRPPASVDYFFASPAAPLGPLPLALI